MELKTSKRFTNPFAPLNLTPEDASELTELAELFVTEGIRAYERFLLDENCQVDDNRWKFMYNKDDVKSYAERAGFALQPAAPMPGSGSCNRPRSLSSSTSDLPIVLVTGTIKGDLDDTIFGLVCPTLDMMRIKTSYVQDTLYRASVLASLVQPTAEDPFRSVSIKWVEKGQPFHVRAVIKNRDFVYMESTGTRYLRNGERVGYQLVHSVQFPETPARDSAIRGNMSMSAVYRQRDNDVVDVFIKGFLNPAGGLTRSIITRSAAKALLSVSKNVHCAHMKKLAWSIRHRCPTMERLEYERSAICATCLKKPSGTHRLLHRHLCCGVCSLYVCSSCRIQKKLHFLLADRKMMEQEVAFCPKCYKEALDAKTAAVASRELLFNDVYGWNETCAYTSGTEISLEKMQLSERLATGDSSRPSRTQPIGTTGGKSSEMVFTDPFPAKRADSAVSVGSVGSATVRMDPSVAKRHQSPFPPLHLSPANATSMENLAQNLVSRNIRMYESFLLDNHSKVDETQWKFVAAKDDLRAYGELPRSSESPHPGYQLETPAADVPVVMITGSVVGDLDDVMYGVVCSTTEQMRIKTSYIHDDIPSSCVLANLVDPTPEAPFNSVNIKWVEVHVPFAVRPVVKHRDFVYLETTGIERLRNGERVGYHIVHSVQFPETPALETHFRGNSSISILYRQRTKNVTDVYIKGFFNPAGGIMRQIVIRSSARILLSVAKDVYCSHMKKLAWALRQKYNGESSSSSSECTEDSSSGSFDDKCCSGCGKKQSVFVQAASRTNRGSKILQKRRHCKICSRYMCLDCRRQHQLTFLLPDQRLKQRLVTICRSCEAEALSESAAAIARDEQLQSNQLQRWDSDDVFHTTMSAQSE
uniref:FYVE-type domain-containing protein n=1 Tax=Phytophthora ramorum TaxID=164328 RepID=H3GRF0_PHYRM